MSLQKIDEQYLFGPVLEKVSRAFSLTLKILPRKIGYPISLAYLLARMADTYADSAILSPQEKKDILAEIKNVINGQGDAQHLQNVQTRLQQEISPAHADLLQGFPLLMSALEKCILSDRQKIIDVVTTLVQGMEMDVQHFNNGSKTIQPLKTWDDLDHYTYLVAGCVGQFWTEICVSHLSALRHWDRQEMSRIGVQFGKALQMTNILRDCAEDLRQGRCYLPEEALMRAGITPDVLLTEPGARCAWPVVYVFMRCALDHYKAAMVYLLSIPRHCLRLRLAVLWPLLMGLATLYPFAGHAQRLASQKRIKVQRAWVYKMMAISFCGFWSNTFLTGWIKRWRKRIVEAL